MPRCVDCLAAGITTDRPTPHGGPRTPLCVTHNRERKKKRSKRSRDLRIEKTYGITPEEYEAIKAAQGGACFICGKAKGIKKNLAVDHDHDLCDDHPPEVGCRNCVRALCCTTCNQTVLGRYDVAALQRAIEVLTDPPAQRILNP